MSGGPGRIRDDDRGRDAVRRQRSRREVGLDASGIGTLRWTELRSTGGFLGLALALAVLAPRRLRIGSRRELGRLAFYGIVGFAFVQWLYFVAIDRLPIGIGLLFEFTAPVLIALWARFAWHEQVRRARLAGARARDLRL